MPNPSELERARIKDNPDHHVDVDDLIRYENGDLGHADAIDLFQRLVNSGLAWQLQGSYGRTAAHLLTDGWIKRPKSRQFEIRRDVHTVNADGSIDVLTTPIKETVTVEARGWDDATVQANAMGGNAEVVAEIERF